MSGFTDSMERYVLDFVTGRVTPRYTTSRTVYLGLLTADPVSTDPSFASLTEVVATGYARKAVTWAAPTTDANSVSTISNSVAIQFGPFTGVAGLPTCTWGFLSTSASGTAGDVVDLMQFSVPLSAPQNETAQADIGSVVLNLFSTS